MRLLGPLLGLAMGCADTLSSPEPSVSGVDPGLVCVEQLTTPVTITGGNLTPLPVDVVAEPAALILPELALTLVSQLDGADGAGSPVVVTASWTDNGTMGFEVTPELGLAPGVYDVAATNADGLSASLPASFAGAPAPIAESVTPDRVCLDQGERPIVVAGSGFLDVGGVLPTLTIGPLSLSADSLDGCTPLAGPVTGERCDSLAATLPTGNALPPGNYDLVVTNPETAACSTETALPISVFPAPTLTSIEPALVCDGLDETLVLTGTGFLNIEGALPLVDIGGAFSRTADRIVGCSATVDGVASCTTLEIDVTSGEIPTGLHPVVVSNPEPVGCSTEEAVVLEVVGPPVVSSLTPPSTCTEAGDTELVLDGTGFLEIGGVLPDVTIDGQSFVPALETCTPLLGSVVGSTCDRLVLLVPAGIFTAAGSLEVIVTNPPPADCVSVPVTWEVALPPTITDVEPDATCDDGETLTITGTNFTATTQVTVGGLDTVETFVSDTEIQATLPLAMGAGVYDVTVTNGVGCADTLAGALTVVGLPYVFYVDPEVVYQAIPVKATVYASGINGDVTDVWLESAADGSITPLVFSYDPVEPGIVLADIPAGLPEGSYHIHLTDGFGCDPVLLDAIFVEADLTLTIDAIDPPFGWTLDTTSTRITSAAGGFLDIPRVYLSPVVQGPGTFATELTGIALADPTAIDGVVPSGLPVGSYDVLVINPDGGIGVLLAGFEVVANQPPLVSSITPGSLPNDGIYPIFILGEGFLGSGVGPPTVEADCVNPDTGMVEAVVAVVSAWDATSIDAFFDANLGIGNGVCVFTVTNDDGTFGTYSAVSVTNPSQNLYAWRAATSMNTPRRALASLAGRVTPTQRYLYALGGDDGLGTTWDDAEAAQVDPYGEIGAWSPLPTRLPAPRAFAGSALVGRYLYLVGGTDGAVAQDTVWRAQILDPLESPQFGSSVTFTLGTGVELAVGTYVYRVAALFDSNDDENPGGESLPSDPFVIRIPDIPEHIALTLSWTAVPGASGYRVYRSSTGSGNEEFLVDTATGVTTVVDVGAATDPAIVPLPSGSMGEWKALDTLSSTREGACVAAAPDPVDPDLFWLIAAGGRAANGVVRSDIEILPITVVDEHNQDAGVWQTSAFALPTARWQCAAFVANSTLHSKIPAGDTWVYFGAGLDQTGNITDLVDAMLVGSSDFDLSVPVSDMRSRAGYVYASANNFLYSLGGSNAAPDAGGDSAEICAAGDSGCSGGPPELGNFNSLGGGALTTPRYLAGSAQESSVIFAVGGETDVDPASVTVEYTNY